jgi:hypothetical protein
LPARRGAPPAIRPVDAAAPARHFAGMVQTQFRWPPRRNSGGKVLDMTLQGDFVAPPASPVAGRVLAVAVLVAVLAGALALAALLLYLALVLIPVMIGAGLIAYAAFRWQVWRARRASLGGQRDLFRP